MERAGRLGGSAISLLAVALALGGCLTAPPAGPPPPPEYAAPPAARGPLATLEDHLHDANRPEASGFRLIERNEDGLRWRLVLVDSARSTLDLQYYIWAGDTAGLLVMRHVVAAADRGVKVRLIIDDLDTIVKDSDTLKVRDSPFAKIDRHPNIKIRLFNPWYNRSLLGRGFEAVGELGRLNHRMHNKLLVADDHVAIVGSRNIGAEYLGLDPKYNFYDLDVLGVGPMARQASAVFDRYWNSPLVTEVAQLGLEAKPGTLPEMMAKVSARLAGAPELARFPIEPQDWSAELGALPPTIQKGQSRVLADRPAARGVRHWMPRAMRDLLSAARRELLIANAYIIPDNDMIDLLRELTAKGVKVRILTNSLATTDVPAVNAHYKLWRRDLIQAGIELHEARPDAAVKVSVADTPPVVSAAMGLHAKIAIVDRERLFVGSMNLDPRSAEVNSEMGVVVDSPALAQIAAAALDEAMKPENSWRVDIAPSGNVRWVAGTDVRYVQPARSLWERTQDVVYMVFPRKLY
ncbi:MAG TPA: phospholipase D family protein [Methylomirabilota bacterium]|nr:phospholipase D family protein [Methylomirabilota bacterium]